MVLVRESEEARPSGTNTRHWAMVGRVLCPTTSSRRVTNADMRCTGYAGDLSRASRRKGVVRTGAAVEGVVEMTREARRSSAAHGTHTYGGGEWVLLGAATKGC